jgi:hypothetical protein
MVFNLARGWGSSKASSKSHSRDFCATLYTLGVLNIQLLENSSDDKAQEKAPDNGDESRRSQVRMTLMHWAADVSQWRWTNGSDVAKRNDSVKPRRSTDCGL